MELHLQSPLDDGTEDELKDLSSGSDEENSDIPQDSVKKVTSTILHCTSSC